MNNLRRKLQKLFTLLDTFRQEAVYLPMHELLYRIYDKTGYYRYVSALPGGRDGAAIWICWWRTA